MGTLEILRRFDAYPKFTEDFSQKTIVGAIVTILSTTLMIVLIIAELNTYFTITVTEELFVDTTRGHKLQINLDIIIPTISCDYLSLDAMDSAGAQHLHIDHNIFKRRLDLAGNPIDDAKKEDIATSTIKKDLPEPSNDTMVALPKCGSCYGAEYNSTHCCNTCQEVVQAYREKRWNPETEKFVQCEGESSLAGDSKRYALSEGCQINGSLEVNRMGGSFHIAPGKSFSLNHVHIHDVHPFSSSSFNTSHKIKHLSFGQRINLGNTHPIDNMEVFASDGSMMFQYYLKIVPTMHETINGEIVFTNQFSVTRHSKTISIVSGESGMPGVFFSYELSPLMVKYTEKESSLGHLATNVCAIIGGIFTVAGIIDTIFFHSIHVIKQKIELGKFS